MKRCRTRLAICAAGAVSPIVLVAQSAIANSGIQLPLNQYAAGSESAALAPNGNFEAGATSWTASGNIITAAPIFANTANNGLLSAQINDNVNPASFTQTAPAMNAGANYVLSAYVWNAGRYDTSGFGGGDLATVKIQDPGNGLNNISMALEAQASNGGAGSNGYFMYIMANQAQTAAWSGVQLQVIGEEGTVSGTIPVKWAQWDNIGFTPSEQFVGNKWISNAGGVWMTAALWQGGQIPNAAGAVASFTNPTAQTVSVNSAVTVGQINFTTAQSYTINGTGALTIDVTSDGFGNQQGVPEIAVTQGSHSIGVPVTLSKSAIFNVAPSTGVLTMANSVTGAATVGLTKNGAGRLILAGATSYGGNTTVNGGTLQMNGSSAWAPVLTGPGTTDVAGSSLVFDYSGGSPDPAANIQTILTSSYGTGFSSGQIHSSTATSSIGLGWLDDTTAKQVLVRRALYGDANLDGSVTTIDFNLLVANFSQTGKVWALADFNYDTTVNTIDFNLLAANFGKSLPGDSFGTLVPEPCALWMLAFAPIALGRLRIRKLRKGS